MGTELSGQPRVKVANLVSVPITQVILGDITNILGREDKTSTDEHRKRKKKVYRASTDEHMVPVDSTNTKRTCEEDCSGVPSKKRAVSLHDQDTILPMWRLLNNPANNNEFPILELSGAWEPPDRASAS